MGQKKITISALSKGLRSRTYKELLQTNKKQKSSPKEKDLIKDKDWFTEEEPRSP